MNTIDAAVGKWSGILIALGVDQKFLKNKHGPCPLCSGKDRFRFDDKNGTGSYYCSGCGAGDGMSLAMKFTNQDFKSAAKQVDSIVGNVQASNVTTIKRDPALALRKVFSGSSEPKGTLVEKYLSSRCLELPQQDLSFHPAAAYYENGKFVACYPAMLATFSNSEGQPNTLHVTYLSEDGRKRDLAVSKKIMTPKERMGGGAIRLFEPAEVMGIAEGIETALAAAKLDQIPVWASANANMLEQWQPPAIAKCVHIYSDNDMNYAGQASAYKLANKLSLAGLQVIVATPNKFGDWNDVLIETEEAQRELARA